MIRAYDRERSASRNREGMALRSEVTNLRWRMHEREKLWMTGRFPIGITMWMGHLH